MSKGILVQPKTYFVGATSVNYNELRRYLEDTDQMEFWEAIQQAKGEGLSDGEVLVSYYAKLCYSALTTKKNENISQVRNIHDNLIGTIKSGHGCYDIETEVLTADGWKFWPDVTMEDRLATRTYGGVLEYHRPVRLINFVHKGRMYRVDSQGVDLLVTPDHKMLACPTTTREGRKLQDFRLIKAEDLGHASHAYVKTADWFGGESSEITEDEAAFLGFHIGDGHYAGGNTVRFRLRRERKIAWLTRLVARLGWGLHQDGDRYTVSLSADSVAVSMLAETYNENGEKRIPARLLLEEKHIAEALYEGLLNSDGHVGRTGESYDTTSPELASQIQHLALHLGIAANVCYVQEARESSYGDKPLTRLSILRRNLKPELNRNAGCQGRTSWVEDWEGEVFCAEVTNNTLYVRRGGKPVWSGNSVFEHCYLNFTVTNCSRVFTHELVRHRVGTSFSQTSGRYVRADRLDLVIDPILAPIASEVAGLQGILEAWYADAAEKLGLTADGLPFDVKKKMTSALRRLLPNGQANEIGFGVNLRALRNLIVLRTSRHAEWEIRLIFNQIADLVRAAYPALFEDESSVIVDGLPEITFSTDKL